MTSQSVGIFCVILLKKRKSLKQNYVFFIENLSIVINVYIYSNNYLNIISNNFIQRLSETPNSGLMSKILRHLITINGHHKRHKGSKLPGRNYSGPLQYEAKENSGRPTDLF